MKPTTGSNRPRRLAAPKPRSKVRLDLKRRPEPESEPEFGAEKKSNFWKWVTFVALLHLLVIGVVCVLYQMTPAPKPPEQFLSLLPEGETVKGTAGVQQAHKLGPTTAASIVHHHTSSTPPPSKPVAITPPKPKLLTPPPVIEPPPQPSDFALDKPTPPAPPKPPKPKPPKVKVDLTLADAPDQPTDKPKPKHHPKKPVVKPTQDAEDQDSADTPDSTGLSKEEIAAKLGDKLDASGVKNATAAGTSGASHTRANSFADFYASIRDQVMSQWQSPNLADETAVNPVVQIHVESDGRVPAEDVHLIQSSGNPAYDDSAVSAAKNLGYLHEPLPEGCPPDIPITFKLTR
jgi:TonB family protein